MFFKNKSSNFVLFTLKLKCRLKNFNMLHEYTRVYVSIQYTSIYAYKSPSQKYSNSFQKTDDNLAWLIS